jgi:hypothetical protein
MHRDRGIALGEVQSTNTTCYHYNIKPNHKPLHQQETTELLVVMFLGHHRIRQALYIPPRQKSPGPPWSPLQSRCLAA